MPGQSSDWLQKSFVDTLVPSIQVGAASGVVGATFGSVYGLYRSPNPAVFATASGVSSFIYGLGIFYVRGAVLAFQPDDRTTRSEVVASGAGGAVTGALVGATYRRFYNVARSSVVLGLVAATCQAGFHVFVGAYNKPREQRTMLDRIVRWTPLRKMEDSEYEEILSAKISHLDAELATVDARLEHCRQQSNRIQKSGP